MYVFEPSDIVGWDDLGHYIAGLRVPIPIILSLAEIIEYRATGELLLTTRVAYPVTIYFAFVMALWLASADRPRLVLALILSLVYVWGLRIVHGGNPQTYDVIFPLLILIYIALLDRLVHSQADSRATGMIALGAGLALSLAELTRPFAVFLLPFLILAAWRLLRPWGRRCIALFLAPLIILSGGWHLHYALAHGGLVWSNHSGFNLQRAWPMVGLPPLVEEVNSSPLASDRWPNLNTGEHAENSRRIQTAVVAYIRAHPNEAIRHVGFRVSEMLSVKTGYYHWQPDNPGLRFYRLAVWVGLIWLVVQIVIALAAVWQRNWTAVVRPESQLIFIIASTILMLALAEAHEEARLIVTVLPLLAALPRFAHHKIDAGQVKGASVD